MPKASRPYHYSLDLKTVRALLDAGAAVNARDIEGKTPLHWMVETGIEVDAQAVRSSLEAGADVCARDDQGRTPLHVAASLTTSIVARECNGSTLSTKIVGGGVNAACEWQKIVQLLLDFESDVNLLDVQHR